MSARILFVEDDAALGAQVVENLRRQGFVPTWIRDGDRARELDPEDFDLVLLDLMLPGTYGMDLLRRYRARSEVPVLVLSAREDASDKVRALSLGADDYVTKPFWPEELIARVRARLRRPVLASKDAPLRAGAIRVDVARREVRIDDHVIDLTSAEFAILATLARRIEQPVTRASLVDEALDRADGGERALDVHVSRLRKKLGNQAERLETVWGIGYKLTRGEGER